jgi:hypothetical protein
VYLYLIFDFTIEVNAVNVESKWYEGDSNSPILIQNKTPKISEELISFEKHIHNNIETIILQQNNNQIN